MKVHFTVGPETKTIISFRPSRKDSRHASDATLQFNPEALMEFPTDRLDIKILTSEGAKRLRLQLQHIENWLEEKEAKR